MYIYIYQSLTWMEGIVEQRCAWPNACPNPNRCGQCRRHSRLRKKGIVTKPWVCIHAKTHMRQKSGVVAGQHPFWIKQTWCCSCFTCTSINICKCNQSTSHDRRYSWTQSPQICIRFSLLAVHSWNSTFHVSRNMRRICPRCHAPNLRHGPAKGPPKFRGSSYISVPNPMTGLLYQLWPVDHCIKPCGTLAPLMFLKHLETMIIQ